MKYWILEFKNQTDIDFKKKNCDFALWGFKCQTQLRWTAHHNVQMNHGNHSNIVEEMKIYANFSYMLTLIGFLFQYFFSKKMKPVCFLRYGFHTVVFTQRSKLATVALMIWWRLTQSSTLSHRADLAESSLLSFSSQKRMTRIVCSFLGLGLG